MSKILSLDNIKKNFRFPFVLCSLIRIFAADLTQTNYERREENRQKEGSEEDC